MEVGAAHGQNQAMGFKVLILAAKCDICQKLIQVQLFSQGEKVGLIIAPLEHILLLHGKLVGTLLVQ